MADAIALHNLSRSFGDIKAVDDVSLTIQEGEMFGLVGPDGSGKTTAIRMLCGILAPTGGTAIVLGKDVMKQPDLVKKEIGYLSQRFSLYGDLSIDENIEFFAEINKVYDYKSQREQLLEFTRLKPFRNRLAEKLSGGMKQKLGLACTLIHTPKIIFLDEPTTGVDPVSRRDFWKILQSLLKQGITIVMSTPYLDEAERCTRVGLMNKGRLMRVDTPENLKAIMREQVVEIVCDRVRDAQKLLSQAGIVREIQTFGDRLNVLVENAQTVLPAIDRTLKGAGIGVLSTRVIPPSLENVFISLISSSRTGQEAAS
jgi:ABC-2 type transport system ATP-binding protein